ncbi:MAG TPA: RsmB/NOP family class I SAM-dependent RNA methyltransferase [Flavipsychrobacter sp.]|nr:RsmB/NOP family class I SAM-dependent RNA methyltransferase [Flavipsychrobacter sp.]
MRFIWEHTRFVVESYNGGIPLGHYLKNYFKGHRQLGSRDRKMISEMVYCWYRCGKVLGDEIGFEERIRACLFGCETGVRQVLQFLPEGWKERKGLDVGSRIAFLQREGVGFDVERIMSFQPCLSEGMDRATWLRSMLQQPRLFIRIRERGEWVKSILGKHEIAFVDLNEDCLSLPNGAPIDKILPPELYVVQDASSQATGAFFQPKQNETWWDCCSGAGGKSLLLKDIEATVKLTVSDKRATILHNLLERFKLYNHQQPERIIADVSDESELYKHMKGRTFDHIICDAPCSGSGTWARTPEQLYFFEGKFIASFSLLQKEIATNALQYLKKGGRLIYITCSIFRQENEEVVNDLLENNPIQLEEMKIINGTENKADSMFVAVLRK